MGFFRKMLRKDPHFGDKPNSIYKIPENRLWYHTNDSVEQTLAGARCENGIVYCQGLKEFKIGSYERDENGNIIIWNDDHIIRIGYVPFNEWVIHLWLQDSYTHLKSLDPLTRVPRSFSIKSAIVYNGSIVDFETNQPVATYQGDPVAAAAAFVCLSYEVMITSKFHTHYLWNR